MRETVTTLILTGFVLCIIALSLLDLPWCKMFQFLIKLFKKRKSTKSTQSKESLNNIDEIETSRSFSLYTITKMITVGNPSTFVFKRNKMNKKIGKSKYYIKIKNNFFESFHMAKSEMR